MVLRNSKLASKLVRANNPGEEKSREERKVNEYVFWRIVETPFYRWR